MIYIIGKFIVDMYNYKHYEIFDTNTCSNMVCEINTLIKMVNTCDQKIMNADIIGLNEIRIRKWPHEMIDCRTGSEYRYRAFMLTKVENNRFLVCNGRASREIDSTRLRQYINDDKLDNYNASNDDVEGTVIEDNYFIDTYKTVENEVLREGIRNKYEIFVGKSELMGIDTRFSYKIAGSDVIMTQFEGESKEVIIPSFITSIGMMAFVGRGIENLRLNNGLKYIGTHAFSNNVLHNVVIPETVKYIGNNAFDRVKYSKGESRSTKAYILRNKETFVMEAR